MERFEEIGYAENLSGLANGSKALTATPRSHSVMNFGSDYPSAAEYPKVRFWDGGGSRPAKRRSVYRSDAVGF
jgi:hypothetical protein